MLEILSTDESGRTTGGSESFFTPPAAGERACLRIPTKDEFSIADYRKSIGLTQVKFAETYGISLGTLRKWERTDAADPIFGDSFQRIFFDWLERWLTKAHSNAN